MWAGDRRQRRYESDLYQKIRRRGPAGVACIYFPGAEILCASFMSRFRPEPRSASGRIEDLDLRSMPSRCSPGPLPPHRRRRIAFAGRSCSTDSLVYVVNAAPQTTQNRQGRSNPGGGGFPPSDDKRQGHQPQRLRRAPGRPAPARQARGESWLGRLLRHLRSGRPVRRRP